MSYPYQQYPVPPQQQQHQQPPPGPPGPPGYGAPPPGYQSYRPTYQQQQQQAYYQQPQQPIPKWQPPVVPKAAALVIEKSTSVYVGKIPDGVDNAFMQRFLEPCGKVISWKRFANPTTGIYPHFGFAEFETADGVLKCVRLLSDFELGGQKLVIKPDEKTRKFVDEFWTKKKEAYKVLKKTQLIAQAASQSNAGAGGIIASAPVLNQMLDEREIENEMVEAQKTEDAETMAKLQQISSEFKPKDDLALLREAVEEAKTKKDPKIIPLDQFLEKDVTSEFDKTRNKIVQDQVNIFREKFTQRDRGRSVVTGETKELMKKLEEEERKREREKDQERRDKDKDRDHDRRDRDRDYDRRDRDRDYDRRDRDYDRRDRDYDRRDRDRDYDRRDRDRDYDRRDRDRDRDRKSRSEESRRRYRSPSPSDNNNNNKPRSSRSRSPSPKPSNNNADANQSNNAAVAVANIGVAAASSINSTNLAVDYQPGSFRMQTSLQPTKKKSAAPPSAAPSALFAADDDTGVESRKKMTLVPIEYSEEERRTAEEALRQQTAVIAEREEAQRKREAQLKTLIDSIPSDPAALFAFNINWSVLDNSDIATTKIVPWVQKKIKEYLGEEEPSLVQFIYNQIRSHAPPTAIRDELMQVLDKDAQVFVVKLWGLLIFETLKAQANLK